MGDALANEQSIPHTWVPKRIVIAKSASRWPLARRVIENASALGIEVVELKTDRLPLLKAGSDSEIYREAKIPSQL